MKAEELINEVKNITISNLNSVRDSFLNLNDEQRCWKPYDNTWNLNEICAHLNQYAIYYQLTFKIKIERTKFKSPSQNFVSSPLGRSVWSSMKLGNMNNVKRKMKTVKSYNPSFDSTLVKGNDVELFEQNLTDLLEIIESSRRVSIRKIKIPISVSKLIRLKLGDAFLFVVYHNDRHMQQALNLILNPNFPK